MRRAERGLIGREERAEGCQIQHGVVPGDGGA